MKKRAVPRSPLGLFRPADHRGEFFRVLQGTARSQTAVMTIAPGQDGGPEETHAADQIVYVIEGEAELRVWGRALRRRRREPDHDPGRNGAPRPQRRDRPALPPHGLRPAGVLDAERGLEAYGAARRIGMRSSRAPTAGSA
jgi:hypothetical protein